MRQLPTGEPVWDLQFDQNGHLTSPAQGDVLAEVAAEAIHSPGATTSGFIRPSSVGPLPEVQVTPKAWGASRCVDPTAMQSWACAGSVIDPMIAEVLAESPRVVLAP